MWPFKRRKQSPESVRTLPLTEWLMELPTRIDPRDSPSKADEFIPHLRSSDERVRRAAVEALADISMPTLKVVAALATAAKHDPDDDIRSTANEALRLIGVDPEDAKRTVPDGK